MLFPYPGGGGNYAVWRRPKLCGNYAENAEIMRKLCGNYAEFSKGKQDLAKIFPAIPLGHVSVKKVLGHPNAPPIAQNHS